MFNLLRLFGRKDHIDDTAAAFIEGRATGREQAVLNERAARDPGLMRDLESIRDTVSLLRSIESVQAPRSFALSEAPVMVKRASRPRIAMAPAVFAIAAAAVVGLLAIGNLADIVHQGDGNSTSELTSTSDEGSSQDTFRGLQESTGSEGPLAVTEMSAATGTPAPTGTSAPAAADAGDSVASIASVPEGTGEVPAPMATPVPTAGLVPPTSPDDGKSLTGEGGEASEGTGVTSPEMTDAGTPNRTLPLISPDASGTISEDATMDLAASPGLPNPLPQATIAPSLSSLEPSADQPAGDGATVEEPEKGVALPLWQLELGFALFAVVMAGSWMLLQRKVTA